MASKVWASSFAFHHEIKSLEPVTLPVPRERGKGGGISGVGVGWVGRSAAERSCASRPLRGGCGSASKPEQVRVLAATAGGGRGAAASPRPDPRADRLGAAGEKLPCTRRELWACTPFSRSKPA